MDGGGEGDGSIFLVLDVTVNNYSWPASIWGELEMINWSLSVTFGVQTRVIEVSHMAMRDTSNVQHPLQKSVVPRTQNRSRR